MIIYKVKKLEYLRNLGLCATIRYKGENVHLWLENDGTWTEAIRHDITFRPCYDEQDTLMGFTVCSGIVLDNG